MNEILSLIMTHKEVKSTLKEIARMNKLLLYQARLETVLPVNVTVKKYKKSELRTDIVLPGQLQPRIKKRSNGAKKVA